MTYTQLWRRRHESDLHSKTGLKIGRPRKPRPSGIVLLADLDAMFAKHYERVRSNLEQSEARMQAKLHELTLDEGCTDPIVGIGAEELELEMRRA